MFDAATAELIRAAPALPDIDPALLPQRLTRVYVELTAFRLEAADPTAQAAAQERIADLRQMATIYEAIVDRGAQGEARRAAAFVAATAYQIQSRFLQPAPNDHSVLTANSIDPAIAAPLLFLIAEQSPDAREAASRLEGVSGGDRVRTALVESISDLAHERFERILRRAELQRELSSEGASSLEAAAMQALYGLCWRGVVQMVAQLLAQELPPSRFVTPSGPRDAFQRVVDLATEEMTPFPNAGRLFSTYSGPRHLARLLWLMLDGFEGSGLANLPPPHGIDADFWRGWLAHRARTKPVLWQNHRKALATGFLDPGQSAVLVLPTGAGKTTLSEIKIASTLAAGRKVVFLVPTTALVDQLRDDLAAAFPEELTATTPSVNSDLMVLAGGVELDLLEVMTPERCLAILSFAPQVFADVGLIVFDECHLLSPKGGGKRSVDAMLCLLQAMHRAPNADLLLLSAMLTNQAELASWVESLIGKPCHNISDLWKPSRQARGVVIYNAQEIAAATAAILGWRRAATETRAGRRTPRKPPTRATPFGLFGLQHHWHPNNPQDIRVVKLVHDPVNLSIAQAGTYLTPNANKVAVTLAGRAVAGGLKTIVFVQNAGHAPSTAKALSVHVPAPAALNDQENVLWAQIQAELGGPEHSLVNPQDGALPHNGDMLTFERQFSERRFRRSDGVSALVASPTLAQGMNLPAQLAILAGDKRHDDDGRNPLEAHEILNAAGRAGRAGYLANGVVLLVPEPNIVFEANGPTTPAFDKLRQLLPPTDACLAIVDPLTELLDRIQPGDTQSRDTRYLLSRLSAGQVEGAAPGAAAALVARSFYAFQAAAAKEKARSDTVIAAVGRAVQTMDAEGDTWLAQIAAFTGQLSQPLIVARTRMQANLASLPVDILGWSDWLVDWLRDDPASRGALLLDDGLLLQVVRGKKSGGPPNPAEFDRLKAGLHAWLQGVPFRGIEIALGVQPTKVRHCPRARDLALKLASRSFYIILAALAAIAKRILADAGKVPANPAVLETLPMAMRIGIDLPDKAAFLQLNRALRSRVLVHRAFAERLSGADPIIATSYPDLLAELRALLAFSDSSED